MEIITVKKELSLEFEKLEFEELECEDNKPEGHIMASMEQDTAEWMEEEETYVVLNEPGSANMEITVKKELCLELEKLECEELECEDNKPEEFGSKVTELLGLQNVPADTYAPKVSTCQNDQESAHIIIKEEIDCDVDDGSISGLVSLPFADKVAGTTLRRSSRRRCQRFAVGDLLESSSDETSVPKHNKKVRIQTSSLCNCEKRLSTACGARRPEIRSKSSERCEVCGKFYELFCDICGRSFSLLRNLRRHTATHSASKRYTCGHCGKSYSRSDILRQHERLHSGQKYRCAECGKEFSLRSDLSRHVQAHTGEFHCADCGKVFRSRASLRDHVRIHTGERPYHCAVCSKAFHLRESLRDHVSIHTGERPYHCAVCSKTFRLAKHLHTHARLHTGERRYSCDACGRLFYCKQHLKVHACMRVPRRGRRRKLQS